ncbi:MAG: SUMF1/EgtB/PvdO family nonheme iron enzyme [Polyangiaceae bacterium]
MRPGSFVRVALLLSLATTVGALAYAAAPEDAPPESRAQVDVALRALAQAFTGKGRRLAPGEPGTIEHAIAAFAPGKFHPVEEGTLAAPRANARCPSDMANVGGRFCIDRYEGSLVERRDDGASQPWSPFTPPEAGRTYIAQSVAGVVPQGYISGAQAERACTAAHKRLCAPVEWRAACGGSQGNAYPYGPVHIAGKCHDTGVAPMLVLHAAELKTGWGPAALNDARLNQLDGTVAKTGAFADCASDYGVYDMVGNLDEWTADPNGTFQGGFWLDTDQHGEACAYRTIAHEFGYHDYSTGFRCCREAEGP